MPISIDPLKNLDKGEKNKFAWMASAIYSALFHTSRVQQPDLDLDEIARTAFI